MIIVRYTVKPGQAEANAELVRAVFAALPEAEYARWRGEIGRVPLRAVVAQPQSPVDHLSQVG